MGQIRVLSPVEKFIFLNPSQYLLSSLNAVIRVISTNESTEFITGRVIYNPAYTYKFQLKTPKDTYQIMLSYFQVDLT